MSNRKTGSSPYKVQVLDRALAIIDALANAREDASLAELAEKVKLHKSTVHRLTSILERHRILERDTRSGRYRLGLRLFELGNAAMDRFNIRERAHPHLERLVYEVDEKVMEYQAAGVRLIWVVHPKAREVEIHRLDGTSSILREDGELSGEDVVPGFRCLVRDIFLPAGGEHSA